MVARISMLTSKTAYIFFASMKNSKGERNEIANNINYFMNFTWNEYMH